MSEFSITVEGNSSVRLPVGGKYCDRDIIVTAEGGNAEITIDPKKTYIFINMGTSRKSPVLGLCALGSLKVDWGDGTTPTVLKGTSISQLIYIGPHTYAEAGDYVITISQEDGSQLRFMGTSGRGRILCAERQVSDMDYAYLNAVKKVIMGSTVTAIGASAFYYCSSMTDVVIPDTVTSIAGAAFCYDYYLNNVTIPASVTNIQNSTFAWCYAATYLDFSSHTSVPNLQNVGALSGTSADCEIRVPAALYDEWIAATNWATFASRIVSV